MTDELLDDLARRFAFHATIYRGVTPENASPLYAYLSTYISTDKDILQLVLHADRATQVPNLLFGALHYLLLQGEAHPLREFYASLTSQPKAPEDAVPAFRDFCLAHAQQIEELVTSRKVQTNEVGRCTGLLPAFWLVYQRTGRRPLSLIEIGSSAGLHLLWDKYRYHYGSAAHVGDKASEVQLHCSLVGQGIPALSDQMPLIRSRVGIDIKPIDIENTDEVCWLRVLIWPEQTDRAALFERAIHTARRDPPPVVAGNAAEVLALVVQSVPSDTALCIFHSYTLNQCPENTRSAMVHSIEEASKARDIFRVSLEWYGGQKQPQLELYSYTAKQVDHELLAYCESHGRSIEWLRISPSARS